MPWSSYSSRATNLQFHDLTIGQTMPPATSSLLGLNLKFIPKPPFTTSAREMEDSYNRFERSMHLATYFAGCGEEMEEKDTKLLVPSIWRPSCADIPHWVDTRITRFFKRLSSRFKKRKVRSNLHPFQRRILRDLRANQSIVIANTDKGLGPCAIELSRYIRDALIHLQDKSIYKIMSEEEALASIKQLRIDIQEWLDEFEPVIGKEEHLYLSTHLDENEDPFGYFYLLYKIHKEIYRGILDRVKACPRWQVQFTWCRL